MKLPKPDIAKFCDIARKNQKIFIAVFVAIPLVFLLAYLFKPDHYAVTLKIRLDSAYASLSEEQSPKKALENALNGQKYFTDEEISYIKERSKLEEENPDTFTILVNDGDKHRLLSYAKKAETVLADRLGKYSAADIADEKLVLEKQISDEGSEKTSIEDQLKTSDEAIHESEAKNLLAQISKVEELMSLKEKQLELIAPKTESPGKEDLKNMGIFRSKYSSLAREIRILKDTKEDLREKHAQILKTLDGLSSKVERIVSLEKSIDKNSRRLAVLNQLDTGFENTTNIPYRYQAQIVEKSKEPLKIYSSTSIRKKVLSGFAISLFLIMLISLYNIVVDPVISSIEELEKFTNLKVLGAIQEIKRKNPR